MTTDIRATARRFWEEVWPAGDATAVAQMLHPDGVNHEAPPGTPDGIDGAVAVMRWLGSAFSDQRYEIHHLVAEDDMVAVHLTHHGRHTGEFMGIPPRGAVIASRHVHLMRFEDGLIMEHWSVRDDATLFQQLQAADAVTT